MTPPSNLGRQLAKNAAWSAASHLLGRGSLVFASMILASAFDAKSFAAYSFFQLTVSMLAAYASMGLGITASKFFAQWSPIEAEAPPPPLGTLWALSALAGLLFGVITWVSPGHWLHGGHLDIPSWLMGLGVFVVALGVVPNSGIIGLERYAASTWIALLSAIVLLGGALIAASMQSVLLGMLTFMFGSLVQTAGNGWLTIRVIGIKSLANSYSFQAGALKHIFGMAGPMFLVALLAASGSWLIGRIILAGPAGAHGFALYAIGLQWYALALFLPGVISRVLLPRLVKAHEGQTDGSRLLRQGVAVTLLAASSVAAIGSLMAIWILPFYGDIYSSEHWLLIAFLLAAVPYAPANTVANAIVAANRQLAWLFMMGAWFLTLTILAWLTQSLGAWAGALSLGLSAFLLTASAHRYAKRHSLI